MRLGVLTPVPSLERLRAWLREKEVTHVVMESTGSYWIPIFNLLEGHFAVVLANPEEVKTRKGHKTDRKDAEHLADLLRHSHIRSSYKEANYLQFVDAHTTLADFTASF